MKHITFALALILTISFALAGCASGNTIPAVTPTSNPSSANQDSLEIALTPAKGTYLLFDDAMLTYLLNAIGKQLELEGYYQPKSGWVGAGVAESSAFSSDIKAADAILTIPYKVADVVAGNFDELGYWGVSVTLAADQIKDKLIPSPLDVVGNNVYNLIYTIRQVHENLIAQHGCWYWNTPLNRA